MPYRTLSRRAVQFAQTLSRPLRTRASHLYASSRVHLRYALSGRARFVLVVPATLMVGIVAGALFNPDPPQVLPDVAGLPAGSKGVETEPLKPIDSFQLAGLEARASGAPGSDVILQVQRSFPFAWPAGGDITSYMGPEHPLGIDIGLEHGVDSPVLAAAAGTVIFTGGGDNYDYGYWVEVDHGDGIVTVYAHLQEILTSVGARVEQGDLLGWGGSTGKSTGKHLHFEVRLADSQVDPLDVLPAASASPQPLRLSCAEEALVIDQGSLARLDFAEALAGGWQLTAAQLEPLEVRPGAPPVDVSVEDQQVVSIATAPSFRGAASDDAYRLTATLGGVETERTVECDVLVRAHAVEPTYYIRVERPGPNPALAEGLGPAATSTPAREPTRPAPPPPTATATASPLPTASNTPIPTRTPIPTTTPIPTRTPVGSGSRSAPTATPTRTPTKVPPRANTPIPTITPIPKATQTSGP